MSKMWTAKRATVFCLLVCLLGLTLFAQAQNLGQIKAKIGREIDVRCLYPAGTYCDYGVLFPLVLEYHNKSLTPQTFELSWTLGLPVPPEYETVVLEPGAKKRIPFLFPPGAINRLYNLEVNDQNISVGVTTNSQYRVAGLLTPDSDSLDYIRSLQLVKNPYFNANNATDDSEYNTLENLSSLDGEVFPEHWAALEALEVLVCYDLTALNLSNNQYKAIVNWVRQGGELVVVSNGIPTEYRGTPLEAVLPLTPTSVVSDEERVRIVGELRAEAESMMGADGEELLLGHRVGTGRVYYLTVPLLDTEVLGKEQTEQLWRHVFDKQQTYNNGPHSFSLMRSIPELPRTRAGWVALFVILYGIIVGPVNLSILRKKDKMLWSFVTVPVVAIIFAGSAYLVNRFIRPSTPVLRELGYMTIQVEEKVGFAESEQLIFSPSTHVFTVGSDPDTFFEISGGHYGAFGGAPREFGLYKQTSSGGLQSNLKMGTWDVQRFQARANLELESPFSISVLSDSKVEIASSLAGDEAHATVYLPKSGSSKSFTLKPGKNVYDLEFTGNKPALAMTWNEEKFPGREDLINQVHNTRPATTGKLYFWTDKIETPLTIDEGTLTRHDYLVCVEFELD